MESSNNLVAPPPAPDKESPAKIGIWRSIFGWKTLFRWDVLGAVVPGVLIAIGFGVLALDWVSHNLPIGQLCFIVAGILCVAKTIGHAVEHDSPPLGRAFFAIVLCVVFIGGDGYLLWNIEKHKNLQASEHQAPSLATPNFYVGPDLIQVNQGVAQLKAFNGPTGSDIEKIRYDADFFVADLKVGVPYSSVKFRKYFGMKGMTLSQSVDDVLTLPRNSQYPFAITLSSFEGGLVTQALMKPQKDIRKIAGVRLTFTYERAADHKKFLYVAAYEYWSNDGYKTIAQISTGQDTYNSPIKAEILDISDVKMYIFDFSKWEEQGLGMHTDERGKVVAVWPIEKPPSH